MSGTMGSLQGNVPMRGGVDRQRSGTFTTPASSPQPMGQQPVQTQAAGAPAATQQFGFTDQRGAVSPPRTLPFPDGPTTPPTTPPTVEDPFAQYRENVAVFSETGAFKNPAVQSTFNQMVKEVDRKGATRKQKSDKIISYLRTIYKGPAYQKNTNRLTDDFKNFARSLNVKIHGTRNQEVSISKGNPLLTIPGYLPAAPKQPGITEATLQRMYQPGLPVGGRVDAAFVRGAQEQLIDEDTGEVTGDVDVGTEQADLSQADPATVTQAARMEAAQVAPAIDAALRTNEAAQGDFDSRARITAATATASSVGDLTEAKGNATLIDNPVQRSIQSGELITGSAADAATAAAFTEQIQAAEATPSQKATVQGQLAELTADFDAANPPAWAAGALRSATQQMAARGLGASSIAGQAIVQATIEAALPIAQADAAIVSQFEAQNLSNRQQRAMLAAQQRAQFIGQEFDQSFQTRVQNAARIGDIGGQNFTAEQQIQLENSRIANTANLTNLSNKQALIMAEAAALAQLDTQNLSNNQQAAVQNAQNFMQLDLTNLSNRQQTDLFNAQQRIQSMFTDQAATNAARQFNATSQQQTDQFFANLASQTSQFNAAQANAQSQFNAGQRNTVERFNAELNNQRDQFNAQNQLVIAQSNAQWRREIATADTAAVNRANELNASAILDIGNQAYANLWNYYGDTMEWAWTSAENQIDRTNALAIAQLDAAARKAIAGEQADSAAGTAIGSLIGTLGSAWIMCWVAREVYGKQNVQWFIFRAWLQYEAPKWFRELYKKHGETYAKVIAKVPPLKWATKALMDLVVERKKRKHHVSCAY
tara:strand:- start:799 stop:3270 length:2472 start_codon:yes stop_codon:yes gene_type:complete